MWSVCALRGLTLALPSAATASQPSPSSHSRELAVSTMRDPNPDDLWAITAATATALAGFAALTAFGMLALPTAFGLGAVVVG